MCDNMLTQLDYLYQNSGFRCCPIGSCFFPMLLFEYGEKANKIDWIVVKLVTQRNRAHQMTQCHPRITVQDQKTVSQMTERGGLTVVTSWESCPARRAQVAESNAVSA